MPVYQLVETFIKEEEINEYKTNKDLLTLNVSDAGMQMKFQNIDYGTKTKKLLKKLPNEQRKETVTVLRDCYINMAADLQKYIPFDVSFLRYLEYLDPASHKKAMSVARIGKLAQLLSQVITEQDVTLAQD